MKIFNSPSSCKKNWYSKYFNYKPKFNYVFSTDNLPRIKNGTYFINIDDKKSIGLR